MEMTKIIETVLGFGGAGMTLPAFIAFMSTGDERLLRFRADFEQKLIDAKTGLIAASIVGHVAILASFVVQGSWVAFGIVAVSGTVAVATQILQARAAQWHLDARQADPAGFFYCRVCAEVHHIDGGCYADDDSEGSDG